MSWLRKIIDRTAEITIRGPLGEICKGVASDASDNERGKKKQNQLTTNEEAQALFFLTTFTLIAELARADGAICSNELAAVDRIMTVDLNISEDVLAYARQVFHFAKNSKGDFETYVHQFDDVFANEPQIKMCLIDLLMKVAAADSTLHPNEDKMIKDAVDILAIPEEDYQALRRSYIDRENRHYALLSCAPEDEMSVITERYQKITIEYNPDQIISQGFPPELAHFSKTKLNQVEAAYQKIKAERA